MKTEITQWALKYLNEHGYQILDERAQEVQSTPWSYVVRLATTDGLIYIKHTPKLIALEPDIYIILRDQFNAPVPYVIANNAELNCFLMKDSGRRLRDILKIKFDTELYCHAIDQFTSMQVSVADKVDLLLSIGVPDWRLDKLSAIFKHVLSQKELFIEDGLSESELTLVENKLLLISDSCLRLAEFQIKQSIVQPDFHDNNILIDDKTKNATIIDLGEIVISHPFFSLVNCLKQAETHHALTGVDETYIKLKNACLRNYEIYAPRKDLEHAFDMATTLWFVYQILAHHRLIEACNKEKITSWQGTGILCNKVRALLKVLS